MSYVAGQCWTYRTPEGFGDSRMIIGAVITFEGHEPVIGCSVTGASTRQPDGSHIARTIPFLPISQTAFANSVVELVGTASPAEMFQAGLRDWQNDPRGLTYFTVPFDGCLERMIALQMAQIVGAKSNAA